MDRWGYTFEGKTIAKCGVWEAPLSTLDRILGTIEGWAMESKDLVRNFRNILFRITVDGVLTLLESSGMYGEILKLFEVYVYTL